MASSYTPRLLLPEIADGEGSAYVTYNDLARILDALLQAVVQSTTLTAPPGGEADGQCWFVPTGATGAWAGQDLKIAQWYNNNWHFHTPPAGMDMYDVETAKVVRVGAGGEIDAPLIWTPDYTPNDPVRTNTMVRDETYLMVANKATSDRAAPQASGVREWMTTLGSSPAWSQQQANSNALLVGARITFNEDIFKGDLRWHIPVASPDVVYEIWRVDDPLGVARTEQLRGAWLADEATEVGSWITLARGQRVVLAGTVFDLVLLARSTASPSNWSATWQMENKNGNPDSEKAWHQSGGGELRIHHTAKVGGNQQTNLERLKAGDTLTVNGVQWTITGNNHQSNHVRLGLVPASRGQEGEFVFQFVEYVATPIDYVQIANHWSGVSHSYNITVQGLLSTTDYASIVTNDNCYGLDLAIQGVHMSPDWDVAMLYQ